MSREFDTGAIRDDNTGKGRMDLLPWRAIIEVSKLCQIGAEHYGAHNADKGIKVSCLLDSQTRHTAKCFMGWNDEDDKLEHYHYVANAWNALYALQMVLTRPDMVDVPWNNDTESKAVQFEDWISVDDRLPELEKNVLVYLDSEPRRIATGFLDVNGIWRSPGAGNLKFVSEVIDWTPIPEALNKGGDWYG